jgi:hypothetical protein
LATVAFLSGGNLDKIPAPAVGWPAFLGFAVIYFSMNYLLLGALFPQHRRAGIHRPRGSDPLHAGDVRAGPYFRARSGLRLERPTRPGHGPRPSFPLSSPLVMLARAAEVAGLRTPLSRPSLAGAVGRNHPCHRREIVPPPRSAIRSKLVPSGVGGRRPRRAPPAPSWSAMLHIHIREGTVADPGNPRSCPIRAARTSG